MSKSCPEHEVLFVNIVLGEFIVPFKPILCSLLFN